MRNLRPIWHESCRGLGILECIVILLHVQKCERPIAVEISIARITLNAMCVVKHCFDVFLILHTVIAFLSTVVGLHTNSTQQL